MCLLSFFSFVWEPHLPPDPSTFTDWGLWVIIRRWWSRWPATPPHLVWHVVCAPWVVPARLCMTIGRAMDPVITGRDGYFSDPAWNTPWGAEVILQLTSSQSCKQSVWDNLGNLMRSICSAHCCRPFNRILIAFVLLHVYTSRTGSCSMHMHWIENK